MMVVCSSDVLLNQGLSSQFGIESQLTRSASGRGANHWTEPLRDYEAAQSRTA